MLLGKGYRLLELLLVVPVCSLLRAHARIHLRLTRLIAHRWAERSRIVSVQWPAVRWLGWIVGERHDIAAVVLEVGLILDKVVGTLKILDPRPEYLFEMLQLSPRTLAVRACSRRPFAQLVDPLPEAAGPGVLLRDPHWIAVKLGTQISPEGETLRKSKKACRKIVDDARRELLFFNGPLPLA